MRDELNPADNYGYMVAGLCCFAAAGLILVIVTLKSLGWI